LKKHWDSCKNTSADAAEIDVKNGILLLRIIQEGQVLGLDFTRFCV